MASNATPLAKQLAYMLRDRERLTVQEFGDELSGLFNIMFPNADDKAHDEMVIVGQAIACWLQLLIRSEIERKPSGLH